jgi:4-hydroxy-4-methyl-2-oxoglutarate aldolase
VTETGSPLTAADLAALAQLTTPTVANAIEVFDVRSRSTGFLNSSVRAIVGGEVPLLGYACTARMRAGTPPQTRAGGLRRQLWEHILTIPAPRVVVIEDLDDPPLGAFWGEVQSAIHQALGCVGVVTNGGVRDLAEIHALGFQLFAGAVMVSHAYVHLVEVGAPVTVGGLRIQPGDLLHGDQHGVVAIPLALARKIPQAAHEIEARERTIIDLCRSPEFSVERLSQVYDPYA